MAATLNPALWAYSAVGAQGPQGPPGPNGVLLDSWWVSVVAPAPGASVYVRTVFDGAAIQICGSHLPGYEIAAGGVLWSGYLPAGYQVTGNHWNPILAWGSYGWTTAGMRINYDAAQLVAIEVYDRPASQFYISTVTVALGGANFG